MKFISKRFKQRCAYSALFDPAPTEKRMPRWQRREKIRPRTSPRPEPIQGTVTGRLPWYKRKKVDHDKPSS